MTERVRPEISAEFRKGGQPIRTGLDLLKQTGHPITLHETNQILINLEARIVALEERA